MKINNLPEIPFELSMHGLIIAIAVLAGVIFASMLGRSIGMHKGSVRSYSILAILLGLVFSRAAYCALFWNEFEADITKIIAVTDGGFTLSGAFLGAFIAALIYSAVSRTRLSKLFNAIIPAAALAIAIGRFSAFFTMEDCGGVIENANWCMFPLGIYDSNEGVWHYAVFAYEALGALVAALAGFLTVTFKSELRFSRGENAAAITLMFYAVPQMIFETLRTDIIWLGFVNLNQALAAVLAIIGFVVLSVASVKHVNFGFSHALRWLMGLGLLGLAFKSQFRVSAENELTSYFMLILTMAAFLLVGCTLSLSFLNSKNKQKLMI
ncbi:MAG: prolipoprotein diacylglyceryl transferase [Oscillospiraceae bacterium]|jgi:phosphatidylglycerol:prolipoprotein diacylglycerol transferase|nr:prolipoprotein diacylglyceryl transferase [Oscillospiraceae bacterium]